MKRLLTSRNGVVRLLRFPAALLALSLAFGCSTSGTPGQGRFESKDDEGFVIVQDVSVASSVRADFRRAVSLMNDQKYDEAVELLEAVTEAAPHVTTAHINLGLALSHVDELERAQASLEAAVASNPDHPVAHNELGIVYRKRGRFEEAKRSYERALRVYPEFHFARRNLAILCDLYLADLDCAIDHYERYHRAVPDDEDAAMWIADLRNRTGRGGQ